MYSFQDGLLHIGRSSRPRSRSGHEPGSMITDRSLSQGLWPWVPAFTGTTRLRIWSSSHVVAVARDRIDHGDLLDRKVGDDLDPVRMHDQHFLDAHAPAEALAVLGLEREHHAGLDLDRMVERPDAGDHRLIVLREP